MKPSRLFNPGILIAALMLCACAQTAEVPTSTPTGVPPTSTATVSPAPTVTSTPHPTATPVPTPTDTPFPVITLPYTPQIPEGAVARYGMGYVGHAVPSPDGRFLAISTSIGTFMYDATTYEEVWSTDLRAAFLAFSPDSRFLAGRRSETFALWEAETGELFHTFEANNYHNLNPSVFSPDSSRVAYGSGNSVVVWNIQSGTVETSLVGHSDEVKSAAFVTDDLLATGGEDGRVVLWNLASSEAVRALEGHEGPVYSLAVSPDGQTLVTGSEGTMYSDAQTILWGALTGEKLYTMPVESRDITFSPDGTLLAARSYEEGYLVDIWDVSSGQLLRRLDSIDDVIGTAFSPDGYLFVASYQTGAIHRVDPTSGETALILDGFTSIVQQTVFSSDGTQLLIAGSGLGETFVRLIDVESGQIVFDQTGFTDRDIEDADISPDGSLIVVGLKNSSETTDEDVFLWDTATGDLIETFPGNNTWLSYYSDVEFSPDGRWLAYRSERSSVTLWDISARQPVLEIEGPSGDLVFLPDGETLAIVDDLSVVLYELPGGEVIREFRCADPIYTIACSPDGIYLAAAPDPGRDSDDVVVILWDIASGQQPVHVLHGHDGLVGNLDFSPDGSLLVSAASYQALLWDVETGQQLETLLDGNRLILCVDFNSDGTRLATGLFDGTVIIWPVE